MIFNKGDKIEWTYEHWLNSKSYTHITKVGIFIKVRKSGTHAKVHFEGNKNSSIIPLNEIIKL